MAVYTTELTLESTEKTDFIDITSEVGSAVLECGIYSGIVSVYTTHTTTAIRVNENEPLLINDTKKFLEKVAPAFLGYMHDDINKRKDVPDDEPANAHSHLKALMLGASEALPFINSKICLGKWQSIFFIDLDGPRKRKIIITVVGDSREGENNGKNKTAKKQRNV